MGRREKKVNDGVAIKKNVRVRNRGAERDEKYAGKE